MPAPIPDATIRQWHFDLTGQNIFYQQIPKMEDALTGVFHLSNLISYHMRI